MLKRFRTYELTAEPAAFAHGLV